VGRPGAGSGDRSVAVVGANLADFLKQLLAAVEAFANDGSIPDL
jgi:hypothetical protein